VKRGDGEDIHAVIWFCDLHNSPPIADSMSREDFLRYLNQFFDCMAGAVSDHGGEVLRFIGDAVLAIFPIEEGEGERAAAAINAARQASERIKILNGSASAHRFRYRLACGRRHIRQYRYTGTVGINRDKCRGQRSRSDQGLD
jgi:class 3 adenylate cyclase